METLSISTVFEVFVYLSFGLHFMGLVSFFIFFFRKKPKLNPHVPFPGVTIFKPCFLIDDNEIENYDAFFNQDYPGPLHIIFVASRDTDPAVPLVRTFLKKYPHVDAEFVVSTTRKGYWPKIDSFYDAHLRAKHDIFII